MADVRPFRGISYNIEHLRNLSELICPPYDVISPDEQASYHQSQYNIIRLEFGFQYSSDSPDNNRYTRAAATLRNWLRDSILVGSENPAFYIIEHRFHHDDSAKSRFNIIARIRVEDFSTGRVLPHEKTVGSAGADRFQLLKACRANLSPIMGLYRGEGDSVVNMLSAAMNDTPVEATDRQGVLYRMWSVTDVKAVAMVSDYFADKALYIADGHHRYSTAQEYQKEQRSSRHSYTGLEGFNFVMMSLMDANDPSLAMAPTHRLVRGISKEKLDQLNRALASALDFELLPSSTDTARSIQTWLKIMRDRGQTQTTFGIYGLDGRSFRLLSLRQKPLLTDDSSVLHQLDVTILHHVVIDDILQINTAEMTDRCLEYTRDEVKAISSVDSASYQFAIFVNPTPVSSVLAVADERRRMPQKSTYFYPKTPAGLVINPLWDE